MFCRKTGDSASDSRTWALLSALPRALSGPMLHTSKSSSQKCSGGLRAASGPPGMEHVKTAKRYIPFSDGARYCLGMNLAKVNLQTCIATLVGNFSFRLAKEVRQPPGRPHHPWLLTCEFKNGSTNQQWPGHHCLDPIPSRLSRCLQSIDDQLYVDHDSTTRTSESVLFSTGGPTTCPADFLDADTSAWLTVAWGITGAAGSLLPFMWRVLESENTFS